jgi:hypothetical protein
MKTKKYGSKSTALLGAIAMVMIAVVSIVGVTFAWFTASPDPRVTGINAQVQGAETLLISQVNVDGTFRRTVLWTDITGVTAQAFASRKTAGALTSVTPLANPNGTLNLDPNSLHGLIQFQEGMEFCPNLFEAWWIVTDEATRDDILDGTFGDDSTPTTAAVLAAKEVQVLFSETGWESNPALKWYTYEREATSGNWIYFPLFFRSLTGITDIYIELPSAVGNITGEGTLVNTMGNSTLARQLIDQSIRMAFIQNALTVPSQDYVQTAMQTVYQPRLSPSTTTGSGAFLGDLLGERGGGHIVPNLYSTKTFADGSTTITGAAGRNLIHIGSAPEFDADDTSTTVAIGVYIWIDGNDIYNTSFAANSDFLAQIQFFGIARPTTTP